MKYANGRTITHNRPGWGNMEVVGTAGRLKRDKNAAIEKLSGDKRDPKTVPLY